MDNETFINWSKPNNDIVKKFSMAFDICFYALEKKLEDIFKNDYSELVVRERIYMINKYYHTRLSEDAKKIVINKICENNFMIEKRIISGDLDAVKDLAVCKNNKFFVFATKYCSFLKPDYYPIYDSVVHKMLYMFQQNDSFYEKKLALHDIYEKCDYSRYKCIIDDFIDCYKLDKCSYRDIDKFLWLVGKNT